MFFLERWNLPPSAVDEQPLDFLRWAPGLAAAWDAIREQEQERRQKAAESQSQQQHGPRFNGGI